MNNLCIQLKKSNCKNCYKCIRHCPVKSIKFQDNQAHIVKDECILCGMCFVACPQNAKQIRNDVDKVKAMLATGKPVVASVAPSFVANYPNVNITSMKQALQKLGFSQAQETAIGATIVKNAYNIMSKEQPNDVIISSCCHTINTLIQKYYPVALANLAKVLSPMQAHCTKIKEENPDAYTVFIGPCISKKDEAEEYKGVVDCVLTFEELTQWLNEEKLSFQLADEKIDESRTRLFPTTGGILRTMACDNHDYSYMAIDGVENCMNVLQEIVDGKHSRCFIEMSACVGSCVGGPAMDRGNKSLVQGFTAVDKYAGKKDFNVSMPSMEKLNKHMSFVGLHHQMPGNRAIEEILKKMGKNKPEDELNCGSCGYNTCRDKAVAVYFGKANITMCQPYLIAKAESFSDIIIKNTPNSIIVINESMEIQQINSSARELLNVRNVHDVLNEPVVRILDPLPYMQVMSTGKSVHNKRKYLAEYGKYVEESILYDKNNSIIITIMRDVTDEETQREKKEDLGKNTIAIADKVIDKQMRVVQEIASLLGETTAETKIALTKLKEQLADE